MLIICCDFHPGFQQIAIFDNQTGEVEQRLLKHREEAEQFYRSLPAGVLVGMEACGHYPWFERLLSECGHQLWLGDGSRIRASVVRKQKTDQRARSRRTGTLILCWTREAVVPRKRSPRKRWPWVLMATKSHPLFSTHLMIWSAGSP